MGRVDKSKLWLSVLCLGLLFYCIFLTRENEVLDYKLKDEKAISAEKEKQLKEKDSKIEHLETKVDSISKQIKTSKTIIYNIVKEKDKKVKEVESLTKQQLEQFFRDRYEK